MEVIMKRVLQVVLGFSVSASPSLGAILYLANAADGSGTIELGPGESGDIEILIFIDPIDTNFGSATVFLDDNNDTGIGPMSVTQVFDVLLSPGNYDRTACSHGCAVGAGDPDCDLADANGNGLVNPLDAGFVLSRFGPCD